MQLSSKIAKLFLFCTHMSVIKAVLFNPPAFPQLVIRVHMSDESSKTMMVDERQTVRQVLDSLLDKSHCGYSPDWSLVETITELQMGKDGLDRTTVKITVYVLP